MKLWPVLAACTIASSALAQDAPIIRDAEYRILERQHADRWTAEDTQIDAKLAEIRERNGGKPPNFLYILLDDVGFGEFGMPDMDVVRGYSTPNISQSRSNSVASCSRVMGAGAEVPPAAAPAGRPAMRCGVALPCCSIDVVKPRPTSEGVPRQ